MSRKRAAWSGAIAREQLSRERRGAKGPRKRAAWSGARGPRD